MGMVPIAFSGEMVRALRDGRKTQTRRLATRKSLCPFGKRGTVLWVRERFAPLGFDSHGGRRFIYAADAGKSGRGIAWQSSKAMPESACRTFLKVTSVRSQLLNSITRSDAIAEGCPPRRMNDPVNWFAKLWDQLSFNLAKRWKNNPRVWVVRFRVCDPVPLPTARGLG